MTIGSVQLQDLSEGWMVGFVLLLDLNDSQL